MADVFPHSSFSGLVCPSVHLGVIASSKALLEEAFVPRKEIEVSLNKLEAPDEAR